MNEFLEFFIYSVLLVFLLLFFFGLIGPKKIRNSMKKFNRWFFYDAALFFPIDPYKPISEAIKEGIENFWPTKRRFKNWLYILIIILGVSFIGTIIAFLFVARF